MKDRILREINRLSEANGRTPGQRAFTRETGIKRSEWYPYIWLRWGEALEEAGHPRNELQAKISDEAIIRKYVELVRELKRIPVAGELRRKAKNDQSFPSHGVFGRLGGKPGLIEAVRQCCRCRLGFEDVLTLCADRKPIPVPPSRGLSLSSSACHRIRMPHEVRASLQDWLDELCRTPGKRAHDQDSCAPENHSQH